jgi:hypothetical protein
MKRRKAKGPKFPRRRWAAGQTPRAEKAKKGKGSYDRRGERHEIREKAEEPSEES